MAIGGGQGISWCPVRTAPLAIVPPLPAAGLGTQPMLPRGVQGAEGAGAGAPVLTMTRPGPAGAGTGGPTGGGERALSLVGAAQAGLRSAAGAGQAPTAAPRVKAAADDPAATLPRPRRSAHVTTCTQSEPAAPCGNRCPPLPLPGSSPRAAGSVWQHFCYTAGPGRQSPRPIVIPPPRAPHRAGRASRCGCTGVTQHGTQCTVDGRGHSPGSTAHSSSTGCGTGNSARGATAPRCTGGTVRCPLGLQFDSPSVNNAALFNTLCVRVV